VSDHYPIELVIRCKKIDTTTETSSSYETSAYKSTTDSSPVRLRSCYNFLLTILSLSVIAATRLRCLHRLP